MGQVILAVIALVFLGFLAAAGANIWLSTQASSWRATIQGGDKMVANAEGANKDYDIHTAEQGYLAAYKFAAGLKPPLTWLPAYREARLIVPLSCYSLLRVCLMQGRAKEALSYCDAYLAAAPQGKHAQVVGALQGTLKEFVASAPNGRFFYDLDRGGQATMEFHQ